MTTKACAYCGEVKDVSDFRLASNGKPAVPCRDCCNKAHRLRRQMARDRNPDKRGMHHGYHKTPTYGSWVAMKSRCYNPKDTRYDAYGAKGITVCERWHLFINFLADMGERPTRGHTIDRFPLRTGNYEPGNCRWATAKEQNRNRSSNRAVVREDGVLFFTVAEAVEATGGKNQNIHKVCRGLKAHCGGFGWRYATPEEVANANSERRAA